MKIIESIPNFSTADSQVIENISNCIKNTPGKVCLLGVECGVAAGRTVFTLAGETEAVMSALWNSFLCAYGNIDMCKQHGVHPRIGACDVCPLVPLSNISMREVVEISRKFGERLGEELGVPVFLYEESAVAEYRRRLEVIRRGEYEGLAEKLKDPAWYPDYGPREFQPHWGVTVLGARQPLLAFNVNLATKDVRIARKIAGIIRESGTQECHPGLLPGVKAIGWFIEEYNCAQVSMNITDFHKTSLLAAFRKVREVAASFGVATRGSELIGLAPRAALPESWVGELGLDSVTSFIYEKKIIENALEVG